MKNKIINKMSRAEIYEALRLMRMSGWLPLVQEQLENTASYADICFEDRLASILYEAREQYLDRQVARIIFEGSKRMPVRATKEEIIYNASRNLNREVMKSLLNMDWVIGARPYYVTISGATGTGKSYLTEVLIREACRLSQSVLYLGPTSLNALTERVNSERLFMRIHRKALVVIEDLGLFPWSEAATKLFYQLLIRRVGTGAMLMTSQFDQDDWYEFFAGKENDKGLADAMMDRLQKNSQAIKLQGESLRPTLW